MEAGAETTTYPDRVDFLANPTDEDGGEQIPHAVSKWVFRGEAQFHKFASIARTEVLASVAEAYGRSDAAADQAERRDSLRGDWLASKQRRAFAEEVLVPLALHHGGGEAVRYVATWFLLILGDLAAGTLVLVYGGEHPVYAAIMMASLGAAAVTAGLLGKDLRRHYLWLTRKENLPAGVDEASLVTQVFAVSTSGWQFLAIVLKAALIALACVSVGTLILRSSVDNVLTGVAFGLWGVAISAGSFWNAWAHLDPAHTTVANASAAAAEAKRAYEQAPTDAIEARAGNLAQAAGTLAVRCEDAWAAWKTCLAAAAEHLRNNPALAGHGTSGLSYLHDIQPSNADIFERLADEFQLPPRRGESTDGDQRRFIDDRHNLAGIDLTLADRSEGLTDADPEDGEERAS